MTADAQAPTFISPGYAPGQPVPVNSDARAGMLFSAISLALLVISFGLLAPITIILSAVGSYLGNKSKRDLEDGRPAPQRDLAVSSFWVGIIGLVLGLLAILAWLALIVFLVSIDPGSDPYFEPSDSNIPELPPELQY